VRLTGFGAWGKSLTGNGKRRRPGLASMLTLGDDKRHTLG
jgi:hypothetical protein